MIVKQVSRTDVSEGDLKEYHDKLKGIDGVLFNAPMFGIDKRIVTLSVDGKGIKDEFITLVNPVIVEVDERKVAYPEFRDYNNLSKNKKPKRVIRHMGIRVDCDNHGLIEFGNDSDDGIENDIGLFKCVMVQRLIDSIDGIDITHPERVYNIQRRVSNGIGRNSKVMLQSPDGNMLFIKSKFANKYIEQGYKMI